MIRVLCSGRVTSRGTALSRRYMHRQCVADVGSGDEKRIWSNKCVEGQVIVQTNAEVDTPPELPAGTLVT
jgi:hypothetical protein